MDNLGCLNSSFALFLLCNETAKKNAMAYIRLQLKPPLPPIQASTLLGGPPFPLLSVRTLLMTPSRIIFLFSSKNVSALLYICFISLEI